MSDPLDNEEWSPYCNECGSCGDVGCCTPLKCAYTNMVKRGCGDYCEMNFNDIEFMYKLAAKMYDKYKDDKLFDEVWREVYE